ncbi:MAG: alpha/beta fold hydrolase [Bdellovibrionales bacterium]|nr:alpha/beta fold hydrolase [Bdellovibrionales bacterium]
MKKLVFLVVALSMLFFATAKADPKEYIMLRRSLEQAERPQIRSPFRIFEEVTVAGNIEQKLDHNSKSDLRTFKQRYWRNSSYARGVDAPVLLFVCGEGACGEYAVGGQTAIHAQKLGAHVFALEHRYYGHSQPFADLQTHNLKYLTTEFALKDLVAFQSQMQKELGLSGKWITIGGSYPGSLSAYARALYPHQFAGALASSAPVMADLDFSEYDEHIARMAGQKCLSAIMSTVSQIESEIVTDEGFVAVKAEFNASVLRDRDDFLYLLADSAAAAVQYGLRTKFCSYLEQSGRAGYVTGVQLISNYFGNLVDMSAQAAEDISLAKNSTGVGMRQWFYQSCTEYGYWQNASSDSSLRSRSARINASYHERLCERLFGIKTPAPVEQTNNNFYLPLLDTQTSKIYFTNGSEDPWMNLSITELNGNLTNPALQSLVIPGAAHCDDLGSKSTPAIVRAKDEFYNLSLEWLSL